MLKRSRTGSISSTDSSSSSSPSGPPSKYTHTSTPEPEPVMQCTLPPHAVLSFPTYSSYEIHYEQTHRNRCSECWKNFPTEHFLDLHIGEHHDPLNEVRRAKEEKTYRCFVEDCEKVCSNPQRRRLHLIDKHMFPKNYNFYLPTTGTPSNPSTINPMLKTPQHRRRSSTTTRLPNRVRGSSLTQPEIPGTKTSGDSSNIPKATLSLESTTTGPPIPTSNTPTQQVRQPPPEHSKTPQSDSIEALTSTLSSLTFIPPSIRFGRGGRRGGLAKR